MGIINLDIREMKLGSDKIHIQDVVRVGGERERERKCDSKVDKSGSIS